MTDSHHHQKGDLIDGIRCIRDGSVATIVIDRQERMNSLDSAANVSIARSFEELDADAGVHAIVVTGAGGRAFCAGADLKAEPDVSGRRVSFAGITGVAGPMVSVTTPLIAAVSGHAIGGGFELAAACDIIVAGRGARFSMPEGVLGFLADSPVGHRALRQLPHHVALDLALTGRVMDATEAERWGFVSYLVDDELVESRAHDLAAGIAAGPPLALRAYKDALLSRAGWPLDVALSTRFESIEQYQSTGERHEGMAAFRERRPPKWTDQ